LIEIFFKIIKERIKIMPKTKTTKTATAKVSKPKAAKSTAKKETKAESCDAPSKTSTASLPSEL
jgi:hypothetical protein